MKSKTLLFAALSIFGMVVAGGTAVGVMSQPSIQTRATTVTKTVNATNGTCDFTTAVTTAEATHWTLSNFSKQTGYYQSSGSAGVAEYIKFYNATSPFAGHVPTSIIVTFSLAGGTANSAVTWSMSLVDSAGAVISGSTQSTTTGSVTTTAANKTWTFTSGVSSAYGIRFDTAKVSGWNLRVYSATVQMTYETTDDPVTSIALDQTSVSCKAGESVALTPSVLPTTADGSVTWASSDPTIATVSGGIVQALKGGTATITATTVVKDASGNSLSASATITVSETTATLAEVQSIGSGLATGATTNIIYTTTGPITVYTSDRQFTISDGTSSVVVYGSTSTQFQNAGYIVGGTITVRGNIKNYNGTVEITTPTVNSYSDSALVTAAWISDAARDSEACATKYAAAKTRVLALDSVALDKFKNSTLADIVAARTRYLNWAAANNDSNAYASGTGILILDSKKNENTVMIITAGLAAVAVALSAVYFYNRRRKHA